MKNRIIIVSLLLLGYFSPINSANSDNTARKYIGVFKNSDPKISGITYGNWGSRPYEYAWISSVVPVQGKRVIDLGVGLPSQYNWYAYVLRFLKPSLYVGVDCDGRMKNELMDGDNFEIKYMDMSRLEYPDKSFDIAYCISTFEHIPYDTFMASIAEAHRVLEDNGLLVITLDEEWDKDQPITSGNGWNTLEQSLLNNRLFERTERSFGLPEFLELVKDYFVLYQDDTIVEPQSRTIRSSKNNVVYYQRADKDNAILHSPSVYNSCVSYAVLKKK